MQGFFADIRAFLRGIREVKADLGLLYFVFGETVRRLFSRCMGLLRIQAVFLRMCLVFLRISSALLRICTTWAPLCVMCEVRVDVRQLCFLKGLCVGVYYIGLF